MDLAQRITEVRHQIDRDKRLEWNERQITSAMNTAKSSLKDIHDHELWKGKYDSFEQYCLKKWDMTRQRAYQIIGAETTRALLAGSTEDPALKEAAEKLNDAQASELNGLPAETALEALKDAVERPGKMTASKMKQAKGRVIEQLSGKEGDEPCAPPTNTSAPVTLPGQGKTIPDALSTGASDGAAPESAPAPSVDKYPTDAGTNVPVDVPVLEKMTDDHCLELSALVSNRVGELTGRAITESEDCHLAMAIGAWLKELHL